MGDDGREADGGVRTAESVPGEHNDRMTTSSQPPRGAMDWSLGKYEHTAAQLLPVARVVVERAAPAEGERLVDIGCGSGNASLLAAARGARVTGIDPAARLLAVAREQAARAGPRCDVRAGRGGGAAARGW